jgi:hypothetical protein
MRGEDRVYRGVMGKIRWKVAVGSSRGKGSEESGLVSNEYDEVIGRRGRTSV